MTIDAWMVSPEDGRGCRAVLPYRGRIRFPMSGKPERAEGVARLQPNREHNSNTVFVGSDTISKRAISKN